MTHEAERLKEAPANKFRILTFLGKSPNAVAAEYPKLIEPEIKTEIESEKRLKEVPL